MRPEDTFSSLRYGEFGDPEAVLAVESRPFERLGPGDLRVRVGLSPINPSDLLPVRGAYRHRTRVPATPGYEGVGVVTEVGSDVQPSWLGRMVLPLRGEGLWQQYTVVPAAWAIGVPESVDLETASQVYINPMTAWLIAKQLPLTSDDVVVANAAGSSLGRAFCGLSRTLGYRLIAVCRTREHTAQLQELGAWAVISHLAQGALPEAVMEITRGAGASVALDSVGGMDGKALIRCLRPGGTVLQVGLLSGIPLDGIQLAQQYPEVRVRPFWLRRWQESVSSEKWHQAFAELWALIRAGRLDIAPGSARYRLHDFSAAFSADRAWGRAGKGLFSPY